MQVILLRHGTRNFTLGDVPLNDEGVKQAKELASDKVLKSTQAIYCSPKQRAQMTITPLSEKLNIPITTIDDLDQMHSGETEVQFKKRVNAFLNRLSQLEEKSPLVICSHSDWLSIALSLIPTDELNLTHHIFQCAEFMHFEIVNGLWKLKNNKNHF